MPVVGSRRVLQTSSEVVLSMKLDDGPLDPNRAISSNDLFTHDEVDRPGIFSVCGSHEITESTIVSGLVSSRSGCEDPRPNQDFDFSTVHIGLVGLSEELVDRSSVRHFFSATDNGTRHSHRILRSIPQSEASCESGTEVTGEEKQWGFIVRTLDMFGLNFQGVKRASVEIGRTGNRMIQ